MKTSIIILLLALLSCNVAWSRAFHIISFEIDRTNITARTKPRTGPDGRNCAMLKIQTIENDLNFEGNIVGDIQTGISEYIVYCTAGSEFIIIRRHDTEPLVVYFCDYIEQKGLDSQTCYTLKIDLDSNDFLTTYNEKYTSVINGQKYIDLGLSVNWAICNVGANSPEEKGRLFAWGELNPKDKYTMANYKFFKKISSSAFLEEDNYQPTKYNFESPEGKKLQPQDDVVQFMWKDEWRMPTIDELVELCTCCSFYFTKYKGISGWIISGPNGNTMFLPANDMKDEDTYYWSSEITGSRTGAAIGWKGHNAGAAILQESGPCVDFNPRYEGCMVRGVISKK